ncbi:MAG: preprotein translocase subunit SecE [Candidatus Caccovivens sp.]
MSKKQKALEGQVENEVSVAQDNISQGVITKESDKKSKDKTIDKKQDKKKDKKKKEKKDGLVKKTKGAMSELKKVTWPSFGEVVKKTGIVIVFVLLFGLFLYGVNALLGWLVSLLVG